MRLDVVMAQNFMSHRDTSLDVTIGQRVQIAGENGSGKTSISVDAVLWCLFGIKGARSSTLDQLTGPWGKAAKVVVRFNVKGEDWEVVRSVGGKSELELRNLTTGADMTEKHVKMTQAHINELLGSYESFVNTAIFRQGDALRFGFMRPEERRTLFEELTELGIYAELESKANRARTASKQAHGELMVRLTQMDEWETDLKEALDEHDRIQAVLESEGAALLEEERVFDEATEELAQLAEAQRKRNMLATDVATKERTQLSAESQHRQLDAESNRLLRVLEDLKASICPTCKKPMNAEEIERQRSEVLTEHDEVLKKRKRVAEDVEKFRNLMLAGQRSLDQMDLEMNTKFGKAAELQKYSQARLPALRATVEARTRELAQIDGKISTLQENLRDKPDVERQVADQRSRMRGYELIAEAFSKRGIPRELMRGFASEVEKATNALLTSLGGASIEIKLDKEGYSKHGVTEGTVDVWYTDGGPVRKVEMLSGGEKMRAMTALRLGIAQAMARRTDKAIKTLILDESLDGLDQRGKDEMMTMLQTFSSTAFDRMLFITHDPSVAGLFPDRVALAKGSDKASMVL